MVIDSAFNNKNEIKTYVELLLHSSGQHVTQFSRTAYSGYTIIEVTGLVFCN